MTATRTHLRITDVSCYVMSIPRPDGTGVQRNWIFVEIEIDGGITGIGEALWDIAA